MREPTFKRTVNVWDSGKKAYVSVPVEVTINIQALAEILAGRAYRSRGKKSCIHGDVIVASVSV